MDDLDKMLYRVFSQPICEPKGYKEAIEKALYVNEKKNKKLKRIHFYKMAAAVFTTIILFSGVVYGGYKLIQNVFNNRKGVNVAISNNYIMDGLATYQESNGISLKINNMLIDDYDFDISFNVKFDNQTNLDDIQTLRFEKMVILDEENNILFHTRGKEEIQNFINNNNLEADIEQFNENHINTSMSFKIRNKQDNQLDLIYNLSANENAYPKSKELLIYAENITINEETTIAGTWQIKQKLEDKFYNRENRVYYCKDENETNISNIEAVTYATGTDISMELNASEVSNQEEIYDILKQLQEQAKNENRASVENNDSKIYSEWEKQRDKLYQKISDIYLKNANGVKFYPTEDINFNEEILKIEEEKIIYNATFDMTLYDCTDEVTLHFSYNNKEYNIILIN